MSHSFIRNFTPGWPTDGSLTDMEALLTGLQRTREVLALVVDVPFTAKSSAAAFALGQADAALILSNLFSKVRASMNGDTDCVNITPQYLRDIAVHMTGSDPADEVTKVGDSIPVSSGAADNFVLRMKIPFYNIQREWPDDKVPSGHQLSKRGAKVNVVAAGVTLTTLNALVLANGTANITSVQTPRLGVEYGRQRKRAWVGPSLFIKERSVVQNPDTENGPLCEELTFETRAPVALQTAIGSLSVLEDGSYRTENGTTPREVAAGFVGETKTISSAGYDITRNTKNAGSLGRTPLAYSPGGIAPDDSQAPVVHGYRTIQYATASNGLTVSARWGRMDSAGVLNTIAECSAGTEAQGLAPEALAVKGGARGRSEALPYSAVWLAPPSAQA